MMMATMFGVWRGRRRSIRIAGPLLALAAAAALGACAPALLAGVGATAGGAAMQERGLKRTAADSGLEAAINADLLAHSASLFRNIYVEVYEGEILLTGSVDTVANRIDAVKIAWRTEGVQDVINEIEIRDDTGLLDGVRDRWITTKLSTIITFDDKIRSVNYAIETVNGTVYLLGMAQDRAELDRVINHARAISYVRRVVSHVRLKQKQRTG